MSSIWGDEDQSRLVAASVEAEGPPAVWTPEHVLARMVEAYMVLKRQPMQVKPSSDTGYWPSIVVDMSDLGAEAYAQRRESFFDARRNRVEADEASRMDEALRWPARFLSGRSLEADALTLYASCQAIERPVKPILAARFLKAKRLAEKTGAASPHEMDLGQVITERALTRYRRAACDRIAVILRRKGVLVR